MSHIFISYSKKDIDFARHLRELLEAQGFAVWMDEQQIDIGEDWFTEIRENIIVSGVMVLIVSPSSTQSRWVQREVYIAENNHKPIFPVLLSGDPWDLVGNIQHENMIRGLKAELSQSFITKLRQIIPVENIQSAPAPLPTRTNRKRFIWISALIGLLLIVGIAASIAMLSRGSTVTLTARVPTDNVTATIVAGVVTIEAQQTRIAAAATPTYPTTPSNTPAPTVTLTPSPSITPTFARDPFVKITTNKEWKPFIKVENFNGIDMVLAPAGCFQMGSTNDSVGDENSHDVCFERPFWIDRYEITNEEYGTEGHFGGARKPRENISWMDANTFCTARGARLPTEAEWEFTARGPSGSIYPWGNTFVTNNAVYDANSNDKTADVGSKSGGISWMGAYDLSGNVWEWVEDWYGAYPTGTQINPKGVQVGIQRVMRGGSWVSNATSLYAAKRGRWSSDFKGSDIGFRCARDY